MMTRWDLWQFRNKIKHAPDGPEATAANNDLNHQIQHELTTGINGIKNDCHHLFKPPYSLEYLTGKSTHYKNMWLTDVWNAREAINNDKQDPEVIELEAQQDAMRVYLGNNIQPIQVAPLPEQQQDTRRQQQISEFFRPPKRIRTE